MRFAIFSRVLRCTIVDKPVPERRDRPVAALIGCRAGYVGGENRGRAMIMERMKRHRDACRRLWHARGKALLFPFCDSFPPVSKRVAWRGPLGETPEMTSSAYAMASAKSERPICRSYRGVRRRANRMVRFLSIRGAGGFFSKHFFSPASESGAENSEPVSCSGPGSGAAAPRDRVAVLAT